MVYTPSGRLIKYLFYCKGIKEGEIFFSPSVERFYKKLDKAKQILENARPPADYERNFMFAMDYLDGLLCDIEKSETYTLDWEKMASEALRRKLEKGRQGKKVYSEPEV